MTQEKRVVSNLAALLEARGLTQNELARRTGVRVATIHALCHDQAERYHRRVLEKIAAELALESVAELLRLEHRE